MTLRDRLLALFREANYSPANETEIINRLGLPKKRRASLAHEIRLLLSQGEVSRSPDQRVRVRRDQPARGEKKTVETRKIFSPTKRLGNQSPDVTAPAAS
jgi:hypothetical protein